MDTKQDTAEIIERLESASGPSNELNALILKEIAPEFADTTVENGWLVGGNHAVPTLAAPFTSSIDSALSLVPEGWAVKQMDQYVMSDIPAHNLWRCWLHTVHENDVIQEAFGGARLSLALSICIAALKARARAHKGEG